MSIAHLFSNFISLDDGIVTLYGLNMGRANQHKMNCNGQRERCPPPSLPFPGKKHFILLLFIFQYFIDNIFQYCLRVFPIARLQSLSQIF